MLTLSGPSSTFDAWAQENMSQGLESNKEILKRYEAADRSELDGQKVYIIWQDTRRMAT